MNKKLIIILLYYNVAFECGDPTENITAGNRKFKIGSAPSPKYLMTGIIECFNGYRWADASPSKTISCENTASWTQIPDCIRIVIAFFVPYCKLKFNIESTKMFSFSKLVIQNLGIWDEYLRALIFIPFYSKLTK